MGYSSVWLYPWDGAGAGGAFVIFGFLYGAN
jgi:hypothetical protein